MTTPNTVFDHLERFGLCETEARIYYFLVHNPSQSILKISRELGVPRTSIYDNSQKLIEKGLLERVIKNNSQRLRALPPTVFEKSLKKQQTTIKDLEESFEILKHSLSPKPDPELEYHVINLYGNDGLKTIFEKSLSSKTIYFIDNLQTQSFLSQEYFEYWLKQVRKNNIELKYLVSSQTDALIRIQKQIKTLKNLDADEVKVVSPKQVDIKSTQIIIDTSCASFSFKDENCVGIEITNTGHTKTMKDIFNKIWTSTDASAKFLM